MKWTSAVQSSIVESSSLERENSELYFAITILGGFHVPVPTGRIDGRVWLGMYIRRSMYIGPLGAGSQLASLALPGEPFWINSVSDPSGFFFMLGTISELTR